MMYWVFERSFTVYIVLLVLNETNKESSAGVNIKNMHQGVWDNANNPSTPSGSNFDSGSLTSTISEEDGPTPGTLMNKINSKSSAVEKK